MAKYVTNVERIIAKIDNDFNPDNSDWIPRVGAWVIDAMSMIDALQEEVKTKKLKVTNKTAYSSETLPDDVKVYDCNGCEIKRADKESDCCNNSFFTGDGKDVELTNTITRHADNSVDEPIGSVATDAPGTYPVKHDVTTVLRNSNKSRTFVLIRHKIIELNFDTECITVKYKGVKTEYSDGCSCELPVIPNNGLLIEAIVYYCMYKMLCRGYKHPVMNLAASQYGTNPYYIWLDLKEKAKRSVLNDGFDEDVDKLWRSAMFIHMFDPRR